LEYSNETGLPSVTDIMSPYIDKRWFKDIHRQRGQGCHDYMACYALELPFLGKGFNPLWKPYIESGKKWFDDNVKEVLRVEERFQVVDFCGQPDLICILKNGKVALVDWKTAVAAAKYWNYQTAAYADLIERNTDIRIDIRMCVRLRKEYGYPALKNEYRHLRTNILITNMI
jgi:hypothetical protein